MYDLTTAEGVKAFNNRVPMSGGKPYDESNDAKFMKMLFGVMRLPDVNLFERIDAKFSAGMRAVATA